jgi:hypothetical protein
MRTQPTSRLTRRYERAGLDRADAAQRQLGLLVAREQPRREPVAPLDLAEEGLAVLRVADRARGDAQGALGAERLELPAIVGEHVPDAGDRDGEEDAPLVHALAEPRDHEAPDELLERAVRIGDEQACRVRAEIDCSDSHLRG